MAGMLAGRVYALISSGGETGRAIAVALAEEGADIAIATVSPLQPEEFAVASIANEVWAIGREQFSMPIDASNAGQAGIFAEEVVRRLGRCDGVVLGEGPPSALDAFLAAVPGVRALHLGSDADDERVVAIAKSPAETAKAVLARLV